MHMTTTMTPITIRDLVLTWGSEISAQSFQHPAVMVVAKTRRMQHIISYMLSETLREKKNVKSTPISYQDHAGILDAPSNAAAWDGQRAISWPALRGMVAVALIEVSSDCSDSFRRETLLSAIKREQRGLNRDTWHQDRYLVLFVNDQDNCQKLVADAGIPIFRFDEEAANEILRDADRDLNKAVDELLDKTTLSDDEKEQHKGRISHIIDKRDADLLRRSAHIPSGQAAAAFDAFKQQNSRAASELPRVAEISYKEQFKKRRGEHREKFRKENKRDVHKLTDEDYTPVNFFKDVWAGYARTGLITSGYLERVDAPLYFALLNYIRGAQAGRPGRNNKLSLANLDIKTERQVIGRLLRPKDERGRITY